MNSCKLTQSTVARFHIFSRSILRKIFHTDIIVYQVDIAAAHGYGKARVKKRKHENVCPYRPQNASNVMEATCNDVIVRDMSSRGRLRNFGHHELVSGSSSKNEQHVAMTMISPPWVVINRDFVDHKQLEMNSHILLHQKASLGALLVLLAILLRKTGAAAF